MSEKKRKEQSSKTPIPDRKMKIFGAKQLVNEFEDSDDEEEQVVKVFNGLKLCLHDDLNRADELRRLISENGGKCVSQTRNASYLVVDAGISPSVISRLTPRAKRMKLVTQKWLLDSLEQGNIQDYNQYQPITPVVSQSVTNENKDPNPLAVFEEKLRKEGRRHRENKENNGPSAFEESLASVNNENEDAKSLADFEKKLKEKRLQKEQQMCMSPAVSSHSPMITNTYMERGKRKSEILKRRSNVDAKQPTVDFADGDESSDETLVVPKPDQSIRKSDWDPNAPKGMVHLFFLLSFIEFLGQ